MKYQADYDKFSGILSDVADFIKTFVAGLKAFIDGFKSETKFQTEPFVEAE